MDPASLASAFVGLQAGQTQSALAAKMLKMNAQAEQAVVQMIDAAAQNGQSLANLAPGVGGRLDVSA